MTSAAALISVSEILLVISLACGVTMLVASISLRDKRGVVLNFVLLLRLEVLVLVRLAMGYSPVRLLQFQHAVRVGC